MFERRAPSKRIWSLRFAARSRSVIDQLLVEFRFSEGLCYATFIASFLTLFPSLSPGIRESPFPMTNRISTPPSSSGCLPSPSSPPSPPFDYWDSKVDNGVDRVQSLVQYFLQSLAIQNQSRIALEYIVAIEETSSFPSKFPLYRFPYPCISTTQTLCNCALFVKAENFQVLQGRRHKLALLSICEPHEALSPLSILQIDTEITIFTTWEKWNKRAPSK